MRPRFESQRLSLGDRESRYGAGDLCARQKRRRIARGLTIEALALVVARWCTAAAAGAATMNHDVSQHMCNTRRSTEGDAAEKASAKRTHERLSAAKTDEKK
ncbi:hypothetical protein Aduo_011895 [Ancylostoma duodenale]